MNATNHGGPTMRNVTARIAGITRMATFTACVLAGANAFGQLELHEVTGRHQIGRAHV